MAKEDALSKEFNELQDLVDEHAIREEKRARMRRDRDLAPEQENAGLPPQLETDWHSLVASTIVVAESVDVDLVMVAERTME